MKKAGLDMVKVTAEAVRARLNLTSEDIADDTVDEMIGDASATLSLETSRLIDPNECSEAEAAAVKNLAAIYALCHLSSGSTAGMNFTVGDVNVDQAGKTPCLDTLYRELERLIQKLRSPRVESA